MKKLFTILVCVMSLSAHAQIKTGNRLLQDLNGEHAERMNAFGYIAGVTDMAQGFVSCSPAGSTLGQVVDMTKLYLENNPAIRHLAADVIVTRVLSSTWPCPKKGQSL